MASHADRLKMSPCFIKSFKPEDVSDPLLRPYKQSMTCVTCHDPHISVTVTGKEIFNNACRNCHTGNDKKECTEKLEVRMKKKDNCFSCHMPKSGTIDIPHVTTTDHYIRKPISKKTKENMKVFIGLYAVNERSPDRITRAKAYINQYEKFEFKSYYLDSADVYLDDATAATLEKDFNLHVHLAFLRNDFPKVASYVNKLGVDKTLVICGKRSIDNYDAWTLYRIGESYISLGNSKEAIRFIEKASDLAPYNLEFLLKLGGLYSGIGDNLRARQTFEKIIAENPKIPAALVNLGYLALLDGDAEKAQSFYTKALSLDPDYEQALMNQAGLYLYRKEIAQAKEILKKVIKKNPGNKQAAEILKSL
jgi:tetratricopeptide (TPR) repeat protein